MRSLRPPSCCRVEVMNGGLGLELNGFSSTDRTEKAEPARASTRPVAVASSTTSTSRVSTPVSSKSLPVARRRPSMATRVAGTSGEVGKAAATSQ